MAQHQKAGGTRNPITSRSESTRRKRPARLSSHLQRTHVEALPDNEGEYIDIEAGLSSLEGEEEEEEDEATPTRVPIHSSQRGDHFSEAHTSHNITCHVARQCRTFAQPPAWQLRLFPPSHTATQAVDPSSRTAAQAVCLPSRMAVLWLLQQSQSRQGGCEATVTAHRLQPAQEVVQGEAPAKTCSFSCTTCSTMLQATCQQPAQHPSPLPPSPAQPITPPPQTAAAKGKGKAVPRHVNPLKTPARVHLCIAPKALTTATICPYSSSPLWGSTTGSTTPKGEAKKQESPRHASFLYKEDRVHWYFKRIRGLFGDLLVDEGDNRCIFGHNQQHHPAQPSDSQPLEEYTDIIHAGGYTQYKKYLDPKNHMEDKPSDVPPFTIARFHRFLVRLLAGQDIPPNLLVRKAFLQFICLLRPELTESKIQHSTKGRELILCQWLEWFHKAKKKLQDAPGKISY
ncbi:hypothetical protein BC835DRAFT_1423780 [Cytidiella melzeri]|nr:hypothetical protein BC835DRAFT_1423780 [Cytidiella melzeri]